MKIFLLAVKNLKEFFMAKNTLVQIEKDWYSTIEILKALSHPVRLYIVNELLEGDECSVGYFVSNLRIDFSNVSKHLAILRSAGIVETTRESQWIYYRITDPRIREFILGLKRFNFEG